VIPSLRTRLSVLSLSLAAALIVMTEFTPVGFLPNVAHDLTVSLGTAGLMILVPGLSAAIAAPLIIVGARRLDRKVLVVLLATLVLVSNGVAAIAPNFTVLLGARVFLGLAIGGFWAVVPPLGFRLAGPAAGTRATSVILAGLGAGTVIGLPAGQYFGNLIGWRWTFGATAILAIPIVIALLVLLRPIPAAGRIGFTRLGAVFTLPIGRLVVIVGFLATAGQFAASTYVTPFLLQRVHLATGTATLFFIGYSVAGIIGTLIGPRLVERDRILTFAGAAAGFGIVLAVLPAVAGSAVAVGVLIAVWGVLWGFVPLALQTQMVAAMPESPEASSAVFITASQLAIAAGAALGGLLVDHLNLTSVFIASGAIAIAAAVWATLGRSRTRRT
jgi:predicted MFS family arabinose efflux permease